MYEKKSDPLLARALFRRRLLNHVGIALALIAVSIGMGIAGYCRFEHLSALDGFLNIPLYGRQPQCHTKRLLD